MEKELKSEETTLEQYKSDMLNESKEFIVDTLISCKQALDRSKNLWAPQTLKSLSDEEMGSLLDKWSKVMCVEIVSEKENWGSTFGLLTLEQINDKNFARFCESIDKKNKEISHLRSQLRLYKENLRMCKNLFEDILKDDTLITLATDNRINNILQTLKQD